MDLHLSGKTALVTGANRGTGQVIAQTLISEGVRVALHSNDADAFGSQTVGSPTVDSQAITSRKMNSQEVERQSVDSQVNDKTVYVCGDIRTDLGAAQVIEQTLASIGVPDILVNNYGTGTRGRWGDVGEEDFLAMYQTNVLSVTRMVQGFIEGMKAKHWGRIIQLGTIGSHQPNSIMPHYYASKGALATLMVGLANELANTGITVNTVSPGLIKTDEVEAGYRAMAKRKGWGDDWDTIARQVASSEYPNPCGRIATREEVADLVTFIASPRADFINGENIRIDGGAVRYV